VFHFDEERHMRCITHQQRLSKGDVPWLLGPQRHGCTILVPHIPEETWAGDSVR
jgi:hypothetical protein